MNRMANPLLAFVHYAAPLRRDKSPLSVQMCPLRRNQIMLSMLRIGRFV